MSPWLTGNTSEEEGEERKHVDYPECENKHASYLPQLSRIISIRIMAKKIGIVAPD